MNHERVKSHDTVPLKMDGTVVYVRYSAHIYMFLYNLNFKYLFFKITTSNMFIVHAYDKKGPIEF